MWIAIGVAIIFFTHYAFLSILVLVVSFGYFVWLWRSQGPAEVKDVKEKSILSYRCLSCGVTHKERICPYCKSNIKQAVFWESL